MSYLRSLGYTHAYQYPGGLVVAFEVEHCADCGKPMMVGVGHLKEYRSTRRIGLKVLREPLPEEGGEVGFCELCSTYP